MKKTIYDILFKYLFVTLLLLPIHTSALAAGGVEKSISNKDASLYIIKPDDGAVLKNPIKIVFGISNMSVDPAGIKKKYSGHHHLLIDVQKLPNLSKPIPSDSNHIHFGKGQKNIELNLEKGIHTLQLLFGDYIHIPHDNPLISKKITITVK